MWTSFIDGRTASDLEICDHDLLDVGALAEEVGSLMLRHREHRRLRWYEGGRVRVLVGKVLPGGSAAAQTLAGRRKRFRQALRGRLAAEGWQEVGVDLYARGNVAATQVVVKQACAGNHDPQGIGPRRPCWSEGHEARKKSPGPKPNNTATISPARR